jgi:hypothetical protein
VRLNGDFRIASRVDVVTTFCTAMPTNEGVD